MARRLAADLGGLVGFIALCLGAAAAGSAATLQSVNDWYQQLAKPAWTPPDWLFGPVWTALYLMMAVAAWWIWRQREWHEVSEPLTWFGIQLALNIAWSFLFFGFQQPGWAAIEIVVLWIAIALTLRAFFKHSRFAGALLAPYLAWTTYASALNIAIWQMNRS